MKGAGWVLLAAFVGWAFWFGANFGPDAPIEGPVAGTSSAPAGALVEESRELERQFEAIVAEGKPEEKDLDLLREAIDLQAEHNRSGRPTHEDRRRQGELEDRLSHFVADVLHRQSEEVETRAAQLREEGNIDEAAAQYAKAYELQREINQRHARSGFRDTGRETRLEQMQMVLRIEPLHERSLELEREGRRALNAEEWDDARRRLAEARDLQSEINETARRSRYYDGGRVTRLNNEIAGIEVGEMAMEVRQLQEEGAALAAGSQSTQAAELFARALSLQQRINRNHPQTRFASTARATELEVEMQTARSAEGARQLAERVARLRGALASGDLAAARSEISGAKRLAEQLFDRYPRSIHVDPELRVELEFLSIIDPALEDLQRRLTGDLLDIPGMEGWKMLQTEVPQELYQAVMNANPSRHRGAQFPVDSVTFQQASNFCRRASWLLGRPVQLVTREQFTAALGGQVEGHLSELTSGDGVREVRSGEPNPHGFYHLVGNLGQWLQPSAEENGAGWVAGGVVSLEEGGSAELFRQVDRSQRSREIGFRYAVHDEPRL